ncbi:MAG: NAD(P)/FAD-dependent oxidoreductase [Acidobacteriia bacterium]|nr:NAD(P)/FAD-dependent oxidoreductase [Terriglobia bacterium]
MPQTYDAIIVGAGHNGLVTAGYLAHAGLKTLVVESRPVVGGACVTEEVFPGYKVSTTSYLCSLLQEKVIKDLQLEKFGYRVYPKNPAFFSPFPDGRYLIMWSDVQKTCEEIRKFSARDAEAYPRYEEFVDRLARFVEPLLLETPPDIAGRGFDDWHKLASLGRRLMKMPAEELVGHLRILTQSVKDFLDPWFESEALKVVLATDGVIGTNGGPYTPGTAYVLFHHCMGGVGGKRGLWGFVRGGMGGITQALAASAHSRGAEIRTGTPVGRVLVKSERATGVALATGEEITAKLVVSNADPKRTFLKLVGEKNLDSDFASAIRSLKMEGCSMKINLALDGLPNFTCLPTPCGVVGAQHKTTIHICPTLDYIERAYDESKYGRPSERPMLEITLPTTYDDSLAPEGKHLMNIFLQYTPYSLSPEVAPSWHALKESYADRVMEMIEEYAPGFKNLILHRHIVTPLDLEEEYGMTGGNIFHGEMSVDQLFFLRPVPGWAKYRTPIRGLYLCGSGTHPGGGVMGAPGFNAAREILKDWKKLKRG